MRVTKGTAVQLEQRDWELGEQIGGGGFGQIYAAKSSDYEHAVAKFVPKDPGAERELLFVNLEGVRNVVPIIDRGEADDSWVLVMPRAEESLREHLTGPLDVSDAVAVLTDIATALSDLDGRGIVHRDLKPENVLLLNGNWSLADFGISRYAEMTTAPDTRKYALSPPYAAPERWRNERATSATDVYSLGVIAYELLSGSRPFVGPQPEDYRDQHLHHDPSSLPSVHPPLAALIKECLYKAPEARPSPANILARLSRIEESPQSGGLARLQEADRAEVARRSESARRASEEQSEAERRAALAGSANSSLTTIVDTLKGAITSAAPSATLQPTGRAGWSARLNRAELEFIPAVPTPEGPWGSWESPQFDVIAHAALSLRIPPDQFHYEGRSHSLWYCDAQESGHFQWFETSFRVSPFVNKRGRQNPFALDPSEESAKALWVGISEIEVAWPFTPLNIGELDEFVDRWAAWLADAALGNLRHPSRMPERSANGSWRTS